MNLTSFLSFWITNSLFFYLAFLVWPQSVVLGNEVRSPIVAAMLNGFLLTLIVVVVPYILKLINIKVKQEGERALVYFVFNAIGIWILARLAKVTGFGITAFWVALILGAVVNLLQWGVWKTMGKKSK